MREAGEKSIASVSSRRFYAIVCEIVQREFCLCAAKSGCIVDLEFVSQGYHDLENTEMSARLQKHIDKVDPERYEAILLGFALCNNGVVGLSSSKIPLVIPRAHDCITLLLGSRKRYSEFFDNNPGTYYISAGWLERDAKNLVDMGETVMSKLGLEMSYEEYVEKYGKENADFILETIGGGLEKHYENVAFIDTGVGDAKLYRETAREQAELRNFKFHDMQGDLSLIQNMLDGRWNDDDYLILKPGEKISACHDGSIMCCCQI